MNNLLRAFHLLENSSRVQNRANWYAGGLQGSLNNQQIVKEFSRIIK